MQPAENFKHLLRIFIGPRAAHYLSYLEQKNVTTKPLDLSWAGLIFGVYWLLYRKMYSYFFLWLAIMFVVGLVVEIVGLSVQSIAALSFVPNILIGLMGKDLYLKFAQQKTKAYMNHPKYNEKVFAEEGGVSLGVPVLWLFIQIVVVVMLSLPFIHFSPL